MPNVDTELVAEWIEQQCKTSPPDHTDEPIPELFEDYDPDSIDAEIADLWQWGLIKVELRDGEQYLSETDFNKELCERDWLEQYINVKLGRPPSEGFTDVVSDTIGPKTNINPYEHL